MKPLPYRLLAVGLGLVLLVVAAAALFFVQKRIGNSAMLRTASELLTVHHAMTEQGLSGFLPGNHSRLGERLHQERFTSVTILPDMVSASYLISVPGAQCGTSILLLKNIGTNTWTVWRDIHIGKRYWKSRIAIIDEPQHSSTKGSGL